MKVSALQYILNFLQELNETLLAWHLQRDGLRQSSECARTTLCSLSTERKRKENEGKLSSSACYLETSVSYSAAHNLRPHSPTSDTWKQPGQLWEADGHTHTHTTLMQTHTHRDLLLIYIQLSIPNRHMYKCIHKQQAQAVPEHWLSHTVKCEQAYEEIKSKCIQVKCSGN